MGDISLYFDKSEFDCKCGCSLNVINMTLVGILDNIRDRMNRPIVILSGCRCEKHNAEVGGESNSAHLRGNAVDVESSDSQFRFFFEKYAYEAGIRRLGEYKSKPNMIHIDVDKENPQDVKWLM